MREILFFFVFLTGLFVASCGTMTVNGGLRNSIYYTSEDVLPVKVEAAEQTAIAVNTDEETYEEKLHKFDRLTYTVNVTIDPWYYTYWRWNYHYPYYYDFGWTWSWGYSYWDGWYYYGYYQPFRHYYPSAYYSWYRPYYTYNYWRPYRWHSYPKHHNPRDVRYTRRGSVAPAHRNNPGYKPNNGKPRPKAATSRPSNNPTRRATVSRSGDNRPRQVSKPKTSVRYNTTRTRPNNQADRTGYGRSTTSTVRRSDTYTRSSQPRGSERYTPQRSNTGYSGNSNRSSHSSGGSSTRRK